jgi:hypothetical protein
MSVVPLKPPIPLYQQKTEGSNVRSYLRNTEARWRQLLIKSNIVRNINNILTGSNLKWSKNNHYIPRKHFLQYSNRK